MTIVNQRVSKPSSRSIRYFKSLVRIVRKSTSKENRK